MKDVNSIANMRKVYQLYSLDEKEVDANPMLQFQKWWQQAIESRADEANAMTLATCDAEGKPSARIVLLKGISDDGFVFFTNYESRKAKEIETSGWAALVFFWKELERQVRVEGKIHQINSSDSDEYFSTRPRESQIGAWSSPQSTVIENADFLKNNVAFFNNKFEGKIVPRPSFWGGYIIEPTAIEFWQGKPGRLHDRIKYFHSENKDWEIRRLAP